MVKIKLKIDPTQPKQVEALNLLLMIIGEPKIYPTKIAFANPNPDDYKIGHSVGFEVNQAGAKVTTKLDENVHNMVEAQKAAEETQEEPETKPERKATKVVPVPPVKPEVPTGAKQETTPKGMATAASLEQIREVLGKKVTDHRDKIKAKLTELEAKNVSVLDAIHYDNFYNFLTSL